MERVEAWRSTRPAPTGDPDEDLRQVRDYAAEGEALLARLPPKAARSAAELGVAESILEAQRAVRTDMLNVHVETVYAAVTRDLTRPLRLCELVAEAGDRFPGVLPPAVAMEAEQGRPLALQEGREIDQAVFVSAVLSSARCGEHLLASMRRPTPRALALLAEFESTGAIRFETVRLERQDAAACVTLQNDDCLNAEDVQLVNDLETAVDLALLCRDVRVGVLRGGAMRHPKYAGRRVFCAGMNLRALSEGKIGLLAFLLSRELGLVRKLRAGLIVPAAKDAPDFPLEKPWVAAVDTFAIGGGMQLLFNFDKVIAAADAYFSLPAAQEGLVPGAANLRIGRAVGSRLARRMILSGHRILATDPEAQSICDEVVPAAQMDQAIASAVSALDGPAVRANRHMLNLAEEPEAQFRAYMAEFALVQAYRAHSADVIAKAAERAEA